jgi:hypothetical protein
MVQLAALLPAVDSDRGWRLRRLPHAVPFGFHGNWLDDAEMVTGWCTRLSGGPDPVGGGGHAADGRSRDWRAFIAVGHRTRRVVAVAPPTAIAWDELL